MRRRIEAGILAVSLLAGGATACSKVDSGSSSINKQPGVTRTIDLSLPKKLPAAVKALIPNAVEVAACADGKGILAVCEDSYSASGYIVKSGVVRTAGHLYNKGVQPERCDSTAVLNRSGISYYINGGTVEYAGKIKLVPDRAVLHVDTTGAGAQRVHFDNPQQLKPGQTLFAIGFPITTAASERAAREVRSTIVGLKYISSVDGLLILAENLGPSYTGIRTKNIHPGDSGGILADTSGGVVGTIIDKTTMTLPRGEYNPEQVSNRPVYEVYAAAATKSDVAAMSGPVSRCR